MSNLSKLLKFENFNTEHLSVAVDMNSSGEMSKFVIPLFDNFVLRNFNISLLLPVSYETDFLFSGYLSFLWKIDLLENKIILYRNGLPEFEFVKEGNNFYCKETGEIIFSEVIDNVDEFRIKDGTLSYFFDRSKSNDGKFSYAKRIEFEDGFKIFVDTDNLIVLRSYEMNEGETPCWRAEFDSRSAENTSSFKIYQNVGSAKGTLVKGTITKEDSKYLIELVQNPDSEKCIKRKYEYQVKDDYNSLSYLEDDIRTENINFYEEGDNLEIRLYGQVKEHRYNLERGLDYIKLEDKTYTDYPLSKIYTLRKSSDISYYYITSSYSNNGYGSCFNLDEKGRIIETADNIPYACSKDNLLKNIPTNINVVEDKNFAFNNLVNSSSYLLESGKNIVFETSTMVLSQNKYLATLFIKKLEETKEAKIRLQIINGEEKEETYLIDEYIPSSSYVFSCLGYIAKKSGTRPLQLFACFFLFRDSLLFRLIRFFFFFFRSRIKLGGYHHNAVTLLSTFRIRPFFRLKVAFNGYQLTFFQYIEGIQCFILSPGFNPHESGNIRGFFTCLVCTADRDRKACYACCFKTTDFCILTDKTCYCE